MAVDRYTKLVLTVIAVCLVWLSVGGPSLLTPVSAQQGGVGERVLLAGWVDEKGFVVKFPEQTFYDPGASVFQRTERKTYPAWPLPTQEPK